MMQKIWIICMYIHIDVFTVDYFYAFKEVITIFVKNTFSPVDFFVLVEYVNRFANVSNFSRGFQR